MQEETARLQEQEPKLVKAPALLKLMAAPVQAVTLVLSLVSLTVSRASPSTMTLARFSKGGSLPKISFLLILILADRVKASYVDPACSCYVAQNPNQNICVCNE